MSRPVEFVAEPQEGLGTLCLEWLSGNGDGVSFDLTCGAGFGSPMLTLTVIDDATGERAVETVDIRDGVTAWIEAVTNSIRSKP